MHDVLVMGGGPGGYAAAIRAAQLGAKVALLEKNRLGGTCVNRGCIPVKIWLKAVRMKQMLEHGADWGLNVEPKSIDVAKVLERRNGIPAEIRMGMEALCQNNGIDLIPEQGVLKGPQEVEAGGKILTAKSIIIATGCVEQAAEIPGLDEAALTYDDILDMQTVPRSVVIVGDGPIEVEMASVLNGFGAQVTLITDAKRILPTEDADVRQRIAKAMKAQGIRILTRTVLSSVFDVDQGFCAVLSGKTDETIETDHVLAVTRRPHDDLGFEEIGVTFNEEGFIQVDEELLTTAPGVYAIGDVVGGYMLSYAATAMGLTAAENALGQKKAFPFKAVPRGLHTHPEAASVGLTEYEAKDLGIPIEVGYSPMSINGLAMAYGEIQGAVKVIADAEVGQILGIHIVGEKATEMILGASLSMKLEATVEDLADLLVFHPTFSENLVTAVQDALHRALYLPKR